MTGSAPTASQRVARAHDSVAIATAVGLGLVTAGCLAALSVRARTSAPGGSSWTLYPGITWFCLGLVAAGTVLSVVAVFGRASFLVSGAALAGVGAAQVAGMGVVAARHWHPATGMGMGASNLAQLQHTAVALAVVAGAGVIVALWSLWRMRAFPVPSARTARVGCLVCGLAVLIGLPLVAGLPQPENRDLNSLLAYALMWSLTWGVAIALCGWLDAVAAATALAAVSICALLTAVLKPMQDIVFTDVYRVACVFVIVVVAAAATFRFRLRSTSTSRS